MSELTSPAAAGSGGQMRTLAVRITEELRAQLDIIAQLTGRSATEEIRLALEHWIDKIKSDPAVLMKAQAVRAEIEREGVRTPNEGGLSTTNPSFATTQIANHRFTQCAE